MRAAVSLLATVSLLSFSCMFARQPAPDLPLTDSSQSIQFAVGSNLNVTAFDGKSIAYTFHTARLSAFRAAIGFSGSASTRITHTDTYIDDSEILESEETRTPVNTLNIEIPGLWLWYVDAGDNVFLFLGAGPAGRFSGEDHSSSTLSSRSSTLSAGLEGAIGVEWFVHRRISLHSEYHGSALYTHEWGRRISLSGLVDRAIDESDYYSNGVNVSTRRVLFGFSLYF
jgi:hypothetical protein